MGWSTLWTTSRAEGGIVKFKITRPDGTIIEGKGTADDVLKLSPPHQFTFVPAPVVPTWPFAPTWAPFVYEFTSTSRGEAP
jgi:hypothetical protein